MPKTDGSPMAQLEHTLEEYFLHKAPYQLPHDAKEAIVRFAPWIVIIFSLLSLPVIFGALALTSIFSPFGYAAGVSLYWIVPMIALVISIVLNLMALPGLFNRAMQGWRYTFYAELLSILYSILSGNIAGALVGAIIGFYILFQVKSFYK